VVDPNPNNAQVTVLDHTCTVTLPPTFTVNQAVEFKQDFQEVCQNNPGLTRSIIDMSQTTFMDSSGIGALVSCRKLAQKQGFELILQNVSPQVMAVLSLADLDKFFVIKQAAMPPKQVANSAPATAPAATKGLMGNFVNAEQTFITHPSVKSVPKRIMDIVGAIVGLGITAALFVPIAIAIKLDSRGPIFFGQTRCSRMGRRFRMWKFRSMVPNAEQQKHLVKNEASGAIFKSANDPRITRVGRILRKTSLDELPQFWNVLKGEMSLVGTRPPTPDEVERYEIPQWQRLDIKPGMTGEWQVNGRSSVKNFEDIVRLDLKYQENWSLMYDIKLIFKTIYVIFNKDAGAM
jgi:anti-anti-sigma factor